ncbi:MAG: ThuA domain-containing protein [Candidatus Hydrogenedentes bacterium]|nr:ThuA domain-containing protein [Candidatus Hydrogenedentota bacterium]
MKRRVSCVLSFCAAIAVATGAAFAQKPEEVANVEKAVPAKARVEPAKPRKLLVFTLCKGFVHSSIPIGTHAIMRMGEKTGAYTAVHSEDPAMFAPDKLAEFDAVCMLNTTGELFEDPALKQSLLDFVNSGKGLVGIHAATDCFYQWADYGEMIGGYFNGHPWGAGDTVTLKIDDPIHPVNRAFHGHGFSIMDEIYQFQDEPYSRDMLRVLLSLDTDKTDMTKESIKRTDGDFAVAWVRKYGKGRVFYCSLGHNEKTYWNPKVAQHYLDGIQFALGDLEADTTPSAALPADYLANAEGEVLDNIFAEIAAWEPGKDASGLQLVADMVVQSHGDEAKRDQLERRLDDVLGSKDATSDGKQYAAKQLHIMGTRDSVRVLSELLLDPEQSDHARYALERMEPGRADVALKDALEQTEGVVRIGIINTIGARGNPRSVADLARFTADDDVETARAAIVALGKIGGREAAIVLKNTATRATEPLVLAVNDALLESADGLLESGEAEAASAIYSQLYAADAPHVTRLAAIQGIALAKGEQALPVLVEALAGDDASIRSSAAFAVQRVEGEGATEGLAEALGGIPAPGKALLVSALKERGDAAALPAVTDALEDGDASVRMAALEAVGVLGNAGSVVQLASVAAEATGEEQQAARKALESLQGSDVNGAIVEALVSANDGVRVELVLALGARYADDAVPALLAAAKDENEAVRTQAFASLGVLAGAEQLPALVELLVAELSEGARGEAERAVVAALGRGGDASSNASTVLNAYAAALDNVPVQASLIRVLGNIADDASLKALRDAARSRNIEVQKAAVRSLSGWPNATPAGELLEVVRDTKDTGLAESALRGYLSLMELPSQRSSDENVDAYSAAFATAGSADALKLVLASIGKQTDGALAKLVAPYLGDDAVKAEAATAMKNLQQTAYKVSASNNEGEAGKALDGDPSTRWTTGEVQRDGQWFVVDIGWETTVTKVTLDAGASPGDYPRGYEVYLSTDGETWGEPVAKGAGTGSVTEIAFLPTMGRYVKIIQTGSTDGLWWSIHELSIETQ